MELYSVVKKETIRKSIGIGASKEKVWQVLFDEKYLPIWYAEFSLGARVEGTWRVGSKILFTDISGGGLVGKVVINRPCTKLSVEYRSHFTRIICTIGFLVIWKAIVLIL